MQNKMMNLLLNKNQIERQISSPIANNTVTVKTYSSDLNTSAASRPEQRKSHHP